MIPKIMLIALCVIAVFSVSSIYAQTQPIPEWIKNTAAWYGQDSISDDEFFNMIQFLIDRDIITVPDSSPGNTPDNSQDRVSALELELSELKANTVRDIQSAYDDGYSDGYDDGYSQSDYDLGYNVGYDYGLHFTGINNYNVGYNDGYNVGERNGWSDGSNGDEYYNAASSSNSGEYERGYNDGFNEANGFTTNDYQDGYKTGYYSGYRSGYNAGLSNDSSDDSMVQDDSKVKLCNLYFIEMLDYMEAGINDFESKNFMNLLMIKQMIISIHDKTVAEGCHGEDQHMIDSPYITQETIEKFMEFRERNKDSIEKNLLIFD